MNPDDHKADDMDREAFDREDIQDEEIKHKLTVGYVLQKFHGKECIGQEFISSDEVYWENTEGEQLEDNDPEHEYQPFHMIQPEAESEEEIVEDYLNKKEQIAAIIFDYDYPEEEERPSELSCHNIAEEILSKIFTE